MLPPSQMVFLSSIVINCHHDHFHHSHLLLLLQAPFPLGPKPWQASSRAAQAEQFRKGSGDDGGDDDNDDDDKWFQIPTKLSATASVDHRVHARVDPAKPGQHLWTNLSQSQLLKNYRKSELGIRNTAGADSRNYVGHKEGEPANDENPHHLGI